MLDHMIGFLNWLNDRRLDVMYFFGVLYNQAVDVVRNVWQWISDRYHDALRFTRESADSLFRIAQDYYIRAVERARDLGQWAFDTAVNWARGQIDNLFRWVSDRFHGFLRSLDNIKNYAVDTAVRLFNDVKGLFNQAIDAVRRFLQERIDAAVRLVGSVKSSLLREIFEIQISLGWQNRDRLKTLLLFLDNPLGFVLAYVKKYFLFILEWSLAYAIGSTKENLPAWPKWEDVD